jgi:hypothetical protein
VGPRTRQPAGLRRRDPARSRPPSPATSPVALCKMSCSPWHQILPTLTQRDDGALFLATVRYVTCLAWGAPHDLRRGRGRFAGGGTVRAACPGGVKITSASDTAGQTCDTPSAPLPCTGWGASAAPARRQGLGAPWAPGRPRTAQPLLSCGRLTAAVTCRIPAWPVRLLERARACGSSCLATWASVGSGRIPSYSDRLRSQTAKAEHRSERRYETDMSPGLSGGRRRRWRNSQDHEEE